MPRGVALGMVTGILFPVAQIPLSAVLALPFRANIPTAAATTFITNPFTTPPLWVAAYWIGHWILRFDAEIGQPIASQVAANRGWLQWLLSEAGPSTIVGLFILTLSFAVVGYAASAFGWRWWIAHKWRSRHTERRARIRNRARCSSCLFVHCFSLKFGCHPRLREDRSFLAVCSKLEID